ncbi:MAG: hypothetical protein JOY78_17605 [Pseudonocardia sp.]|nr:hypothetical protein [Pseudonocardia sp.]
MEDTSASPHDLLLRLAGRVDDDLLTDARELVAVGEDGHALELLTAALAADGTALPPAVRAELVTAAVAARIDLDAESALAPAAPDTTAHRFTAAAGADVPVIAAARELPDRLRDGIRLRLTWRQTPAGPTPTPLPQPVLLVETSGDGRPGEVLAYQLGAALTRSGVHVAVEVLVSGKPLTGYHAAALRDSTPLSGDAPPRPASPPEKVDSVVAEVVEEVTASHRVAVPEERPVDLFAVDEDPAPRPVPLRRWQSARQRRGFGEQPDDAQTDDAQTDDAQAGDADADDAQADDDNPEADEQGPLPSPTPLSRRSRPHPQDERGAFEPTEEGDWNDEWTSGGWAVAESTPETTPIPPSDDPGQETPPQGVPATPHDHEAGADDPRPSTGGSHALRTEIEPPPPVAGPAHALADRPTPPTGTPIMSPPVAEALLKPEALARLSDTDRDLLTRLPAEMAGGPGRYAPGVGPNGNGSAQG